MLCSVGYHHSTLGRVGEAVWVQRNCEFSESLKCCTPLTQLILIFLQQKTKLSAKNRPHAIFDWIKSGRRCRMQLKDRYSAEYGTQWVAWWDSLNPQWRKREKSVLLQQGKGSWHTMLHAGSNGYVNILAGLVGYYHVAGNEEWLSSARDIA